MHREQNGASETNGSTEGYGGICSRKIAREAAEEDKKVAEDCKNVSLRISFGRSVLAAAPPASGRREKFKAGGGKCECATPSDSGAAGTHRAGANNMYTFAAAADKENGGNSSWGI